MALNQTGGPPDWAALPTNRSDGMTDEKRADYIKALLKERAGAVQYDRKDRVEAVDEELRRLGVGAETPVKRAAKRKAG